MLLTAIAQSTIDDVYLFYKYALDDSMSTVLCPPPLLDEDRYVHAADERHGLPSSPLRAVPGGWPAAHRHRGLPAAVGGALHDTSGPVSSDSAWTRGHCGDWMAIHSDRREQQQ